VDFHFNVVKILMPVHNKAATENESDSLLKFSEVDTQGLSVNTRKNKRFQVTKVSFYKYVDVK